MTKEDYIKAKEILDNESKHSFFEVAWAHQAVDKWEFAIHTTIKELEMWLQWAEIQLEGCKEDYSDDTGHFELMVSQYKHRIDDLRLKE